MARLQDNRDDEDLNNDDNPDSNNDARETQVGHHHPHHLLRPSNSDEPHLLTLIGIARVRLTEPPQVVNDLLPLPRLDVSYPPQDADSPPTADVVQDFKFKAAAIRLLERFSQDTSQSACKRESWTRIRIAHLVEESESHKAAALAVATATDDDRNGNNDRNDDDDCKRSSTMARELDTVVIV
ncbi:hypothetical protein EDB85DRAFT_2154661 [Lactarius pseudohatsudake]|nr:hypothetical protein EDB85DRAFT_2154661 [Lactarius pseudohatsudake]